MSRVANKSRKHLHPREVPYPLARAVTAAGANRHFFGYYDKCPWDASGMRMLAHQVAFDGRPPRPDDEAVVGLIHLKDGNRFEPIGHTHAWNFQQGAMLQWLEPDANRLVVYNDRDRDRFISVIVDLQTRERRQLPRPVATVRRDGRFALSLNYARLSDMRPGYGYEGLPDPWAEVNCPEDDGVYMMDLSSGESRLLLSVAQVAAVGEGAPSTACKQWLHPVLFNQDGTRFCCLHRWEGPDGMCSRLLTANVDGSDLYCLSDGGIVSHFDWHNPRHLLAWARKKPKMGGQSKRKLVKLSSSRLFTVPPFSWTLWITRQFGIIGWVRQRVVGDRFILFTDLTRDIENVGLGVLKEDGHCSYSPDGRWILMDTYPHEDNQRCLLLYEPKHQQRIEIGRFYSMPELTGEIRCDLHARWNRDGTQVCIDSTHEGSRQIYLLDVRDIVNGVTM